MHWEGYNERKNGSKSIEIGWNKKNGNWVKTRRKSPQILCNYDIERHSIMILSESNTNTINTENLYLYYFNRYCFFTIHFITSNAGGLRSFVWYRIWHKSLETIYSEVDLVTMKKLPLLDVNRPDEKRGKGAF